MSKPKAPKTNVFHWATSELSHSAFWAWVLSCATANGGELSSPKALALRFLKEIGVTEPISSIEVKTEYPPPGAKGVRFDIYATVNGYKTIIIENKVKSDPDATQLKKYMDALKGSSEDIVFVILHTGFIYDFVKPPEWLDIDLEKIVDILSSLNHVENPHSLTQDYRGWVDIRHKWIESMRSQLESPQETSIEFVLDSHEGQWLFMEKLTTRMGGEFVMYHDTSKGRPWTQARFCDFDLKAGGGSECWDNLFYRVDKTARGYYYVSLKQYLKFDVWNEKAGSGSRDDFRKAKLSQRLPRLREVWIEASRDFEGDSCEDGLAFEAPKDGALNESEIMWIIFGGRENTFQSVLRTLPLIHARFVSTLRTEGWPIRDNKQETVH